MIIILSNNDKNGLVRKDDRAVKKAKSGYGLAEISPAPVDISTLMFSFSRPLCEVYD